MIRQRLRALRALLALNYSLSLQYRAQSALWMINGSVPLIMLLIWLQLAAGKPIGGYDTLTFAQYFLFMFLCRQTTPTWVIYLIDRAVKQGELSPFLLQPLNPVWRYATEHWGEMLSRFPIVFVVFLAGLTLADAWSMSLLHHLPYFLMSLAMAWIINFTVHLVVGMIAFWADNALGYDTFIYQLYIMLGGVMVPIELFPAMVGKVLYWTPFPYILDFPVRVMIGRATGMEMWLGLGAQLAWIAVLLVAFNLLWRCGLRRYGAAGA
jgi:ABC-2 type transport system permease protein